MAVKATLPPILPPAAPPPACSPPPGPRARIAYTIHTPINNANGHYIHQPLSMLARLPDGVTFDIPVRITATLTEVSQEEDAQEVPFSIGVGEACGRVSLDLPEIGAMRVVFQNDAGLIDPAPIEFASYPPPYGCTGFEIYEQTDVYAGRTAVFGLLPSGGPIWAPEEVVISDGRGSPLTTVGFNKGSQAAQQFRIPIPAAPGEILRVVATPKRKSFRSVYVEVLIRDPATLS